jgi:hypothetical protein
MWAGRDLNNALGAKLQNGDSVGRWMPALETHDIATVLYVLGTLKRMFGNQNTTLQ